MSTPPIRRCLRLLSAGALAGTLLLAACLPLPGDDHAPAGPDAPSPQDGPDASADGGPAGAAGGGPPRCVEPGRGPLTPRPASIVRPGAPSSEPTATRLVRLDATDVVALGLGIDEVSACASSVVLVSTSDPALRALAGARAVSRGVPLVLLPAVAGTPAEERALVDRLIALGVEEVTVYGPMPGWIDRLGARVIGSARRGEDVLDHALTLGADLVLVLEEDRVAQADLIASAGDGWVPVVVRADRESAVAAGGPRLLDEVLALGPTMDTAWAASTPEHARTLLELLDEVARVRWVPPVRPGATTELWLGDVRDHDAALIAAVVATARGAAFVAVDGGELRSGAERTARMRAGHAHPDGPVDVVLVGGLEPHTEWQLDTVLTGTPLPGGGFLPLEDRRIVALYGSPGTPSLGMLGEQDDMATIARARDVAARYADAADGRTVVPGLDVIATIASSAAEPTGDYSRRVPIDQLMPLVDLAREAGMAVFLDLQPGRTSFLIQAQEFEELLREPHVHLALDPEWRIGPGERHLVRIGSVGADEVQAVADWLADLVRSERLPQKVLMLHQFTTSMLPDREDIVLPAELVGVVHIDGQGRLATKNRTYAALTGGAEERWAWGWKNFTRIDVPVATPEQAIDRVPVPVIVTYQ